MNPHDDKKDDAKDEEQIASILKAVDSDAAPPDKDALTRLRSESSEIFAAAARPTFLRRMRWFTAAAAILLVGVGVYLWSVATMPAITLGKALDKFESADTVHLRVVRENSETEVWLANSVGSSRWDQRNGRYRIADRKRRFFVDEGANEVRTYDASGRRPVIDLLDLVGCDLLPLHGDPQSIFSVLPRRRSAEAGKETLVYEAELRPAGGPNLWIEVSVDAQTLRPQSVRSWLDGKAKLLAELTVVAYDEPIAAERFVIADTLTEDGRIGKVTDVQGIVSLKPVLHERWTPVRDRLVLKPGDWVRTDARGANAAALRLVKNTGVILGPKTLVELVSPKQIRVIEGEVEINPAKNTSIDVIGPDKQKVTVNAKQIFRVEKQQLARVAKDPPWLLGFKGATGNEVLGSLVALVNGVNTPLTVGYHKVQVDIRDQIARTVIEQSFVNHTDSVLEGVFHFPLPPDASISGFGMWIGDTLVEADVVEKQRAREIYETILRERRDPGLLEWSGGNIFKARVFPIPANAEKRIKITYTQVLPLKGSRYRYSYALQSELLQQHPLRELSVDVKVNSGAALKSVTSPTHPTRDRQTTHSAQVEFTAQQYTPTRDFEVVVETEGRVQDVVVIPHRRGDDGYMMLQLTPPGAAGDWDRPLLPNGEPVNLLILADTSASIDATQRTTQATFIGALLGSLTPKDSFNLATCDVTCDWTFTKAQAADGANVSAARDFLAARTSLGWSNLDVAFAAALKRCTPRTHVIYVGDGIVTTGDADPVAFTKRLRRLYQGHGASFHAVTLASSYEAGVLRTIASLGGGSMRKITSEQEPTTIARELLGEIAQPALRDIKVEFRGIKAARVYPESLPNIPAGTQQILLGRYLPEGKDQTGEVIVTGMQGDKPVRFSTRVTLKDAEQGNSFIPRLWARMHLDSLLEQGATQAIKDEIVALSEEYQIITPYTSFLVLESDADRERFKVKRRFQMRDGERFFADGRDNVVFDLAQKQRKHAADYRTAVRRSVLAELVKLGRDARLFQPRHHRLGRLDIYGRGDRNETTIEELGVPGLAGPDVLNALSDTDGAELAFRRLSEGEDLADLKPLGTPPPAESEPHPHFPEEGSPDPRGLVEELNLKEQMGLEQQQYGWVGNTDVYFLMDMKSVAKDRRDPYYGQWLNTLFPALHAAPNKKKEPKSTWPAAAQALAKSLLRTEQLAKLTGGIEIVRDTESFDPRWNERIGKARRLELASAKAWLTRSEHDGGQTLVSWCDAKQIGIYSRAFQLGRQRASTPLDQQPPPLELRDHSLISLERAYLGYVPTIEAQGKDRTLLVLKYEASPHHETRLLIDTARHVILSIEDRYKDKVTHAMRFDDFAEIAGGWWARRIESTNEDGKRMALITQTIKPLTLAEADKQTKTELADRERMQFLDLPSPSVLEAKRAIAGGKATFDAEVVLMQHFEQSQQWPRVLDHLQKAEKLAGDKPGLRWLRSAVLSDARRHDELRLRYLDDARRLAALPSNDVYFLSNHVLGQAAQRLQANEMLTLLDLLRPIHDRQLAHVHARKRWQQERVSYLTQTGRTDEALALQKQLATDNPREVSVQRQYADALANVGDYAAAYAWLDRVLVQEAKWLDHEEESLRGAYTNLFEQQGRFADLAKYLASWVARDPASRAPYEQYLTALVKVDEIEKADALALRWLKDAQVPAELSTPAEMRAHAAIYRMLGNGYRLWTNRLEDRWATPLAEAALYFAKHEQRANLASLILSHHQFRRSDEAPRVRKQLAQTLVVDIDKLSAAQIRMLSDWVSRGDSDPVSWQKMTDALRQRWLNETKDQAKYELGYTIVNVLSKNDSAAELLAFLRLQLSKGPEKRRAEFANQLFTRLLEQPWSADFESEALGLLDKLSDAEESDAHLLASVAALHRFTDRMLEARIAASAKLLKHPEKLTRTELMKKQAEQRQAAREGLADLLRQESTNRAKALGPWLLAESVFLDVSSERNLKQAAADAWTYLGAAPRALDAESIDGHLSRILQQRYLITLTNLAARKNADPALIDRLLKYHDDGIRIDANAWKAATYRVLVALDRTKELEQTLQQWTRQDEPDGRWRIALGYLLAEQGRLPEAIREFEAVEASDELTSAQYRALAEWHLVQNDRAAHERAANAVYQTMPEHQLSRLIAQKLDPWLHRDRPLPSGLDKEVLRQFAVLFDKSVTPQSYVNQLQQFYRASHDFRLLAVLPEALVGHTAARVYPFVQHMQSALDDIHDEATADELVKRIGEVRQRAKTDVDKRALDLLELLVERRAAEVQNQPGPHRDKALAALIRASKGTWSPGEPRLMADFLAALGKITQTPLADEQLRQLKALHGETKPGSLDRLHVAYRHAQTLYGYGRVNDAIDLLEVAVKEVDAAHDGKLPVPAESAFATLIDYLEGAGHYARGEKLLNGGLTRPVHAQQRRWLIERVNMLHQRALNYRGETSLGKGAELYQALQRKIHTEFADADANHRHRLVLILCDVYHAAQIQKLPNVAQDVKAFAFQALPPMLKEQTSNRHELVNKAAQMVYVILGPRDGIVFLLNEIESEPRWLRYANQDGWSRHATDLADWRRNTKNLGDVEDRLLKLVLAELRLDLETREARNRVMYQRDITNVPERFWKEKTADFAKTADAVLAERGKSGATALYIAEYFYSGLDQPKHAIEILFNAHKQKLLDEEGEARLVEMLHLQERYGESIAVLAPLVERRPGAIEYRVRLMRAYHRTERRMELLALLSDSDRYFHDKDRWTESVLARLAASTLENELFDQSIAYHKELIPWHERTHAGRGIGNGTLAGYYIGLAKAYASVKMTRDAVDAAASAIVAWGSRSDQRKEALDTLRDVLLAAPDLDAFLAEMDKRKDDSAIIRKAAGRAYQSKEQHAKAIVQLELAALLQPRDVEIYELLVKSHDALKDKDGAIQELLRAVQWSRRDLTLYAKLGQRYAERGDTAQAERAHTSIVEMQPHEAESHALLAEIRERQSRWPEAIAHWEQVAQLRALEPTGLLKLAAAQIHEKRWEQAEVNVRKLESRVWPAQFTEVGKQVRALREQLAKKR